MINKKMKIRILKVAEEIGAKEKEYQAQEAFRHTKEMEKIKNAPLTDRQEAAKEWLKDMQNPELVAERISWLLAGNYGKGAMDKAHKILSKSKGANKVASLSVLIAALEWKTPAEAAVSMWKKLSAPQQKALKLAIEKAIEVFAKEQEEEAA